MTVNVRSLRPRSDTPRRVRPLGVWPLLAPLALALPGCNRGLPSWVLIRGTGNGQDAPLPDNYRPILRQSFGSGRRLTLWYAAGAAAH